MFTRCDSSSGNGNHHGCKEIRSKLLPVSDDEDFAPILKHILLSCNHLCSNAFLLTSGVNKLHHQNAIIRHRKPHIGGVDGGNALSCGHVHVLCELDFLCPNFLARGYFEVTSLKLALPVSGDK